MFTGKERLSRSGGSVTASDLLVGFFVGVVLCGFLFPTKGMLWMIRDYKKQVAFLTGNKKYPNTGESGTAYDKEYPNRKERS